MFTAIPFALSPEAADYVRSRLQYQEAGRKPCLVRAFAYADGLSGDVYYEGEHFQIVYESHPAAAAEHVELFGHQVAILSDTLHRLSNRVLMIHSILLGSEATKYVLLSA